MENYISNSYVNDYLGLAFNVYSYYNLERKGIFKGYIDYERDSLDYFYVLSFF